MFQSYGASQILHGHLKLEVRAAKNLPDMEGFLSKMVNKKDVTDPFVDIKLGTAKLAVEIESTAVFFKLSIFLHF